ncbi:hypothetical protein CPB83DRAFT_841056 [Crepidotus variabilis]|uniref:Uncharacterized protein n=1 Tax=Crepidotus variabilis TaxID=179855 RepID=A0A9P6JHT1_9AGAR|nr:hypothetical protein CPB83DRAFT_841056 [Crepidotus variabilis]
MSRPPSISSICSERSMILLKRVRKSPRLNTPYDSSRSAGITVGPFVDRVAWFALVLDVKYLEPVSASMNLQSQAVFHLYILPKTYSCVPCAVNLQMLPSRLKTSPTILLCSYLEDGKHFASAVNLIEGQVRRAATPKSS